ncbi:MAG: extracellular solute-binding protein [Planctomycetota bacterium]|jgi:ABC-type glycerol-3-phosphate transport system substrate-binding protein
MATGGAGFALWPYRPRREIDIPRGRLVLTYWEKWTGEEGIALQRIIDHFNDSQSRLWVQRVPVSDIMAKAMVAIGGGDPPDLVGLYDFNIPLFAEARAVLPLDDFAHVGPLPVDEYAPSIRRMLTHEGRQWAGITTCHSMALYYNRARLREIDHDPDRPPRTTDELDALADRLMITRPDGRLERVGFLPNLPQSWPYLWPGLFGGRLYDETTQQATLTEPENIATYEWVAGYPRRYGARATSAFAAGFGRSFNTALDPFLTGRAAMIVQGPWIARLARRNAPDLDFAAAPVPVAAALYDPDRPAGMAEADVIMIPRGCRHPEEAYEFIRFTQRRDVLEELASSHCKGSPLRTVSAEFRADHPNPYVGVHDAVTHSPRVSTAPRTRVWPQYAAMIKTAFDAIWIGADVRTELASVQGRVQDLIDQSERRRRQRTEVRS